MRSQRKFAVFAWCVFVYNLLVIAWGAYVRATGSGAGCGAHWPLCNGVVIPRNVKIETLGRVLTPAFERVNPGSGTDHGGLGFPGIFQRQYDP